VKIFVEPIGVTVEVGKNDSLLAALTGAAVDLPVDCGGRGTCGKCLVRLGSGDVTPPTDSDLRRVPVDRLEQGWRLACQTRPLSERVSIEVPQTGGRRQILTASRLSRGRVDPAVRREVATLPPATFEDARSDVVRLEEELGLSVTSLALMADLPARLRSGDFTIGVVRRGREVIDVRPEAEDGHVFGVAIDVGTSKIISYLFDLDEGRLIDQDAVENPQMPFGEDVVTRITEALDSRVLDSLGDRVHGGVNQTLERLCARQGITSDDICDAVVVGNTAMHHLFLGLSPQGLTGAPFAPALDREVTVRAAELGLAMNPNTEVYFAPPIAGFVGSDCLAVIAATRLRTKRVPAMAIDIGTNTEIALVHNGKVSVTSCASGPAFEGYQITCGMKAAEGSIERVAFTADGRPRSIRTIGGRKAVGICGSGVVDILAGLLATGVVDRSGLLREHVLVRDKPAGLEYVVAQGANGDIVFTQRDVRALQLAKGAIAAGWTLLLDDVALSPADLRHVYVAGAFGNYLDVDAALAIGLLPPVARRRVHFVGNAAGVGAQMDLLDVRQRRRTADLRDEIEFRELATASRFHEVFMREMVFPASSGP